MHVGNHSVAPAAGLGVAVASKIKEQMVRLGVSDLLGLASSLSLVKGLRLSSPSFFLMADWAATWDIVAAPSVGAAGFVWMASAKVLTFRVSNVSLLSRESEITYLHHSRQFWPCWR